MTSDADARLEQTLRSLAPQVLASLLRSSNDFAIAEDATQEALLAASRQWPTRGWPDNPKAWLVTVAGRRRIELWRSEAARRAREHLAASEPTATAWTVNNVSDDPPTPAAEADDTLTLFVLCCHPAISPTSQVALTLRAVGGLTTAEIGRALLVPETTVAQRISRAKAAIRAAGGRFELPAPGEIAARVAAVRHVLYLIFNEGYLASAGSHPYRAELSDEAIRLTRQLHTQLPDDGETAGLLALMLLTDARRPARLDRSGTLIPLADQDRSLWNRDQIAEGAELLTAALRSTLVGPYQLQAAIAAIHDEAVRFEDTDWDQILALYDHLDALAPGPIITLNRIAATAMAHGPGPAQAALDRAVATDPVLARHPRVLAVRAHLLEMAADPAAADAYRRAATASLNTAEQRHLTRRAARLDG